MEPRELFVIELGKMLYVERTLADEVLPKLLSEVENKHFREALDKHLGETREQVARIEQVFDLVGEAPRAEPSEAFDGLRRDHEKLVATMVSGQLRDLAAATSAAHTEHHEISAYHSLMTLASILGEPDAVHLLEQSLHEEEEALEKVEKSVPEELTTQLVV